MRLNPARPSGFRILLLASGSLVIIGYTTKILAATVLVVSIILSVALYYNVYKSELSKRDKIVGLITILSVDFFWCPIYFLLFEPNLQNNDFLFPVFCAVIVIGMFGLIVSLALVRMSADH